MALKKPDVCEYELFCEYWRTGDIKIRDELVSSYIYIAEILSRKFINRGIDYDDIYQVASMGVLYAVERFNPDRGVKFATFATPTVMGEIRKYFRDKGNFVRIPRRLYEVFYRAERIKSMSADVTDKEIARRLDIPYSAVREANDIGGVAFMKSLEYEAYADGTLAMANVLGEEDNQFLMLENKDFVEYCMKQLDEKERTFVKLRYTEEMSQQQIAEILGVSQMQVSRMERSILKKLRNLYFRD
ncbi:MAG: sigma-70 family RNA polymerase sigma factor [Clostridia bacterium]|nr:sigma-70 family RNA polymerase sigma factor [Clostridia bacterium]